MSANDMTARRLILASTSPRRRAILERAGLDFEAVGSDYEEDMTLDLPPAKLAERLSQGKAASVSAKRPEAVVLAADTIVVLDGRVLGKPKTPERAREMLAALSGRAHSVITGFTVSCAAESRSETASVESAVVFKPLTPGQIDAYVATGEPLDKAGAYAVQERGGELVERVEGDYLNVVGLPLDTVLAALARCGIKPRSNSHEPH